MKIDAQNLLPAQVKDILKTLNNNGYDAYVVGGAVRDMVLNEPPHDWDITTSASPEKVKELFSKTIDTGIQHGTVTAMIDGEGFEITTFRKDGDYSDGRHPDSIEFASSIEDDLSRRDFTINAMAVGLDGKIIDPFGGIKDIEEKKIRCVGNPDDRFSEDALRMLRAARFMSKLNFDCDGATLKGIIENKDGISQVSKERINDELTKMLLTDNPEKGLDAAFMSSLLQVISPEINQMFLCEQNQKSHYTDVAHHSIDVVKSLPKEKELRWAGFLHDIGKPFVKRINPKTGEDTFYGHPQKSAEITKELLKDLRFSNDKISKITELVLRHDEVLHKDNKIRKFVSTHDDKFLDDLTLLKEADLDAHTQTEQIENFRREAKDFMSRCSEVRNDGTAITIKELCINGKDLMDVGLKGKEIGQYLNKLLEECLSKPEVNNCELLEKRLAKLKEKTKSKD